MSSTIDDNQLEKHFELHPVGGWIALHPVSKGCLTGFKTNRMAKLVDGHFFQFTIGATKLGLSKNLNETIRTIIHREGVEIVEGFTTDGSGNPKKEYPGFSLKQLKTRQFDQIVFQVFGAVAQVQQEKNHEVRDPIPDQ
jgi:hypothetical protein